MARDWELSELEQEIRWLMSLNYSSFEQECLNTSLDQVIKNFKSNENNLRNILHASKDFMDRMPNNIAPLSSLTHQRFLKSFQIDYACKDKEIGGLVEVFRYSQVKLGDDPEIINCLRAFTYCYKDVKKLNRISLQYLNKFRDFSHIRKQIIKSLGMCASEKITDILNSYSSFKQEEVFKIIFDGSFSGDDIFNDIVDIYSKYKGNEDVHSTLRFFRKEPLEDFRKINLTFVSDYKKILSKVNNETQLKELNNLFNNYLSRLTNSFSLSKRICNYLIKQPNLNDLSAGPLVDYFNHFPRKFEDPKLADSFSFTEINKITLSYNLSISRFPKLWDDDAKVEYMNYLKEVEQLGNDTIERKRLILEWCDGVVKGVKRAQKEGLLYQNNLAGGLN